MFFLILILSQILLLYGLFIFELSDGDLFYEIENCDDSQLVGRHDEAQRVVDLLPNFEQPVEGMALEIVLYSAVEILFELVFLAFIFFAFVLKCQLCNGLIVLEPGETLVQISEEGWWQSVNLV